MSVDLWRMFAMTDIVLIFGVGTFLHLRHSGDAPLVLRLAAWGGGALLFFFALGIFANLFTAIPPTLGVKVFAVGAALVGAFFLTIAVIAERRPHSMLAR